MLRTHIPGITEEEIVNERPIKWVEAAIERIESEKYAHRRAYFMDSLAAARLAQSDTSTEEASEALDRAVEEYMSSLVTSQERKMLDTIQEELDILNKADEEAAKERKGYAVLDMLNRMNAQAAEAAGGALEAPTTITSHSVGSDADRLTALRSYVAKDNS